MINTVTTSTAPSAHGAISLGRWPDLAPPRPAPLRTAVARAVMRRVARHAGLRVELPGESRFGPDDGPVMRVNRAEEFFTRLGRDGLIGFGEAYMAADWDADDLTAVVEVLARDVDRLVPRWMQWLRGVYEARQPAAEDNDRAGARSNIHRHYDLSNDLFAAFLDETMTYSSALFDDPSAESLTVAQHRKIDRLLDQAGVGPDTRVLEIGTGWGELAIRAARRGASVTTITLSEEQAALAIERSKAAGVAGLVDVRLCDYRDVDGTYDAIVSVEMIEAVGERWWPTYFEVLDQRLAPGGRVGLQAIVMPHRRMLASRRSYTWIHKYIFPGGKIASVEAIEGLVAPTALRIVDTFAFGRSYAETLRRWNERFAAAAGSVEALGFDETFRRMWAFYLSYCEAGFRAGYLDVVQFAMEKSG